MFGEVLSGFGPVAGGGLPAWAPVFGPVLGFVFLSPVAGIVAGLLGGAGVVAFYFLKLRRRPVRVSTVAFWEEAARDVQVNAPFRMLRPSVLLLLQLLAVALLAAALGRPSIDRPIEAERVFVLIDRSASMSALDVEGGSRFAEAKRLALDFLDGVPRGSRVSVIGFAADARSVVDSSSNRAAVASAVGELLPTDQPADAGSALEVLGAFVNRASEEAEGGPAPLVAVVSDGNFALRAFETAPLGGAEVRFLRAGPVLGAVEGGGDSGSANAGIVGLAARRDYDDPALVRVFARVLMNEGWLAERGGEAVVTVSLNGEAVGSREVVVDEGEVDGEGGGGDARGSAVAGVTFRVRAPSGGVVRVAVGGGDALASDDAASVVLLAPERPAVLVVGSDGGPMGAGSLALVDALEASGTARVERVRLVEAVERGLVGTGVGAAGFDVVVYDGVEPGGAPSVDSIGFDAAVPGGRVSVDRRPDAGPVVFSYWRREHPLMRAVSLGDVIVEGPSRVVVADGDEGGGPPVRVVELASSVDGPLIVLEEGGRAKRVTVGFGLDRSNWWRFPSFPLFVANAVEALGLRPGSRTGVMGTTGERVRFEVGGEFGGERVELVGPGDETLAVSVGEDGVGVGEAPRLVGLYALAEGALGGESGGGDARARVLAVNLVDEVESSLVSPEAVGLGGVVAEASRDGARGSREVWHWFVLGSLVVLFVEWLVFAGRLRV